MCHLSPYEIQHIGQILADQGHVRSILSLLQVNRNTNQMCQGLLSRAVNHCQRLRIKFGDTLWKVGQSVDWSLYKDSVVFIEHHKYEIVVNYEEIDDDGNEGETKQHIVTFDGPVYMSSIVKAFSDKEQFTFELVEEGLRGELWRLGDYRYELGGY
jgi:hypothetical protein